MRHRLWLAVLGLGLFGLSVRADEIKPIARVLPPPGIAIAPEARAKLQRETDFLTQEVALAAIRLDQDDFDKLLPDVEIYLKAVQYALQNDEFYDPKDVDKAHKLLARGRQRLKEILSRNPSWPTATGVLARGFRSRLDDSTQPYGLVIPEHLDKDKPCPLYVWLHGRGDKATELGFITGREGKPGEFQPADAIVVHPFGRFCNGFKFAGEIDVLEAVEAVEKNYNIDKSRIVLCGFSMGGAGVWHLAAHYPDRWVAASPGAGFAETARYQNIKTENFPAWYEQKLWGLYDVPGYVLNLFNLPVIAYSGELDKQIQAARVMEEAYQREGRKLEHLIGPGVAHKYNPETLKELQKRLANAAKTGKSEAWLLSPNEITLETQTLRYNTAGPVEILRLQEHWKDSRLVVDLKNQQIQTRNVARFRLTPKVAEQVRSGNGVRIDGSEVRTLPLRNVITYVRASGGWEALWVDSESEKDLRKIHGLQGPIDDAFMEPFMVVVPTVKSENPQVERWVQFELAHFLDRWKRLFRGTPRIKKDTEIHDDAKKYHLITWGDPSSNQYLALVAKQLPLAWDRTEITVGDQKYSAAGHVLSMIYPNPLEPSRYLVVNSGPTYREGHDSSNSLQTPKLPDWAVIDLSQPPDAKAPGKIAAAGFFDEQWRYQAEPNK